MPHTCLCRQVAHSVESLISEETQNTLLVNYISSQKSEAGIVCVHRNRDLTLHICRDDPQFPQAVELQPNVVVPIEIVDAEHLVTLPNQTASHVIANETRYAGNENLHRGCVPTAALAREGINACPQASLGSLAGITSAFRSLPFTFAVTLMLMLMLKTSTSLPI